MSDLPRGLPSSQGISVGTLNQAKEHMMAIISKLALILLNPLARMLRHELTPLRKAQYIDAAKTIRAAKEKGVSVYEYVESMWDQNGCTDRVIEQIGSAGGLTPCDRVCEVGPGTGRYLSRILRQVSPRQYDIYEIADDWTKWLARTHGPVVVPQPADGRTLRHTPSQSCGLVHAHGVFVYLPLLHAFEYLQEMCRVCAPGGFVVFDFFSDEEFSADTISRWLASTDRYPVILPRTMVLKYFSDRGFTPMHEFEAKYGHSYSRYMVFQRSV